MDENDAARLVRMGAEAFPHLAPAPAFPGAALPSPSLPDHSVFEELFRTGEQEFPELTGNVAQITHAEEEVSPQHTPDSPTPQGAPFGALRRVPSDELTAAFDAPVRRRSDGRIFTAVAQSGFKMMKATAQPPNRTVAQRMHDALEAKLGKVGAGLQPAHRALMIVGIARSALENLGGRESSSPSLARSMVAETYVRQAGLIPEELQITLPHGGLLSAIGQQVSELPAEDQALYMEAMCGSGVKSGPRSNALEGMKTYHDRTGRSLTADLCNPDNGSTLRERRQWVNSHFLGKTGERFGKFGGVPQMLAARAAQAGPATE